MPRWALISTPFYRWKRGSEVSASPRVTASESRAGQLFKAHAYALLHTLEKPFFSVHWGLGLRGLDLRTD